jgi:hypothetical protein
VYENQTMSTIENQQESDAQAVILHVTTGKPLDPEVRRRVREQADKITARLRAQHGDRNLAVDLIRSIRDE